MWVEVCKSFLNFKVVQVWVSKAVVGGAAGPAMAGPLFLPEMV